MGEAARRQLVVDSRMQRVIISRALGKPGQSVPPVDSGEKAL